MTAPVRLAWLFDIDGTLLLTGGAAREAFVRAVRDCLGREDDLEDIAFAGRIDPQILGDIFAKHGIEPEPGLVERIWESIVAHMRDVLQPGRGALLPGIPALLDAVASDTAWVATLLTGNTTRMAALKLRHFGIEQRFAMGAFGEEARTRDDLACLAVRRIGERFGLPPSRCVVIGDTPNDIACARAAGARVVAVATGFSTRAELEAHGPDRTFDDLTQPGALFDWAREIAKRD